MKLIERSKVARGHPNFPNRGAVALSESGLYLLTLRSDKPEAKCKTGGYLLNEEARDTAKADDRAGMPIPEEFAQFFQLNPKGNADAIQAEISTHHR